MFYTRIYWVYLFKCRKTFVEFIINHAFLGFTVACLAGAGTACNFFGYWFLGASGAFSSAFEAFLFCLSSSLLLAAHVSWTFLYSVVKAMVLLHLLTFSYFWILFLLNLASVTSLWILGALNLRGALPFFLLLKVLLMACFLIKATELDKVFSFSTF